jgi:ubiquinone biosynthesis protein COQ9
MALVRIETEATMALVEDEEADELWRLSKTEALDEAWSKRRGLAVVVAQYLLFYLTILKADKEMPWKSEL